MVMAVQLQVKWLPGKQGNWNAKQQKDFRDEFKKQVEGVWNNSPFVLVSKTGKKQYSPQIEITFVQQFTNKEHIFSLEVSMDPVDSATAVAYVRGKVMYASAANALIPYKYNFIPNENAKPIVVQCPLLAHEFGHLIGVGHPGEFGSNPEDLITVYSKDIPSFEGKEEKGPNSPAAYEADVFSLMGRGSELRWWMFQKWTDNLNNTQKADGPWRVSADKNHAKYKQYYQSWETYCKLRLEGFPGAALAFVQLMRFEQK